VYTVSRHNQQDFAYRRLCYDGSIQTINSRAIETMRDHAAEAGSVFAAQNNRLADHGIFPAVTMAGREGSVIIAGPASESEKALQVLFGVPALERNDITVRIKSAPTPVRNHFDLRAMMLGDFGAACAGKIAMQALTPVFASVTGNDNVVRPVFVPQDMRLAA
jgi:hypothetical protein